MRDYVAECICLLLQLRACASHVQLVGPGIYLLLYVTFVTLLPVPFWY